MIYSFTWENLSLAFLMNGLVNGQPKYTVVQYIDSKNGPPPKVLRPEKLIQDGLGKVTPDCPSNTWPTLLDSFYNNFWGGLVNNTLCIVWMIHTAIVYGMYATCMLSWWVNNRAEKSDFWKSISKAAAHGALSRLYPPCIVNSASDVLDG